MDVVLLWLMIRNTYIWSYITVPGSEILKFFEVFFFFFWWEPLKCLLLCMRWLWKSPKDGGWLAVEPILWLKCWNVHFHPLIWEREEGLEVDVSHQWHHQLNGQKSRQALGDGEGQGSLECCSPWGHEESHTLSHWTTTTIGQWFNQWCLCNEASRKS